MSTLQQRLFPQGNFRNIAMFYILSGVYNAWFIAGVWVFIWGAFMTKTQIGISDSITFTIGFLVELPSGVFADLIGRRKAIVLGNIMLTLGNLLVGLSSGFVSITVWYLVWIVGYAFQSGATEALAYDTLKQKGLEAKWNQVITTSTVIGRISSLTATSIGGLLFAVGFRLPYMAAAVVGIGGIIAALFLKEIKVKSLVNFWSVRTYLNQVGDGIKTLIKPRVLPFSLLSLSVISIGYMYNWGFLRPMTGARFGFTATTIAFLFSTSSLIVIFSMTALKWLQARVKLEHIILAATLAYGSLFFVIGFNHQLIVGGSLMIILAIMLTYVEITFSQFINEHTAPEHRATTLSAIALFTKMPYVLLALVIGRVAENNQLPLFTIIIGAIAMTIWAISFYVAKRKGVV